MSNENLFELMVRDYGRTLLESEMEDIKAAIRMDEAASHKECISGGECYRDKYCQCVACPGRESWK